MPVEEDKKIYRKAYYGFFMVFMGTVSVIYFSDFMEYIIQQNLKLSEGSKITENWLNPPTDIYADFYLFNVTNYKDIRNGQPPNLSEIGPYVVRMKITRKVVKWHQSNNSLTYLSRMNFYYEEGMSIDKGEAPLWTVNLPVVGMVSLLQDVFPLAITLGSSIINGQLNNYKERLMKKYTVREFMVTGLRVEFLEPLIRLISAFADLGNLLKDNKIGILHMLNNTPPAEVVVHTGNVKPYAMGEVVSAKSMRGPEIWKNKYCSMINGSEGSNFRHPLVGKHQYFFLGQLCRSLKLDYVGEDEVNGIPTKKYIFDSMLASGKYLPENKCFCNSRSIYCSLNGTIPLGPCMMGIPLYISQPHFYGADPYYQKLFTGLKPSKEKHETYFKIHPMLAMPLQVKVSLQFNLKVINHPNFPVLQKVQNMLLPIAWIDLSIGILNSGKENLVYYLLVVTPILGKVVGVVLAVFGAIRIFKAALHSRKKKSEVGDTSSAKVYPIDTQPSDWTNSNEQTNVEKF